MEIDSDRWHYAVTLPRRVPEETVKHLRQEVARLHEEYQAAENGEKLKAFHRWKTAVDQLAEAVLDGKAPKDVHVL